jgi:hypothetical protein
MAQLAEALVRKALAGDVEAIKLIWDLTEGKVSQRVEGTSATAGRAIVLRSNG